MTVSTHPSQSAIAHVRLAGLLYLIIILCGLTSELVLRGPLLQGPPESIAATIAAAMPRFRASLLGDLIMLLADIALALLFFSLLRPVSAQIARAAMVFRLMQAALIGASLILLSGVPALLDASPAVAVALTRLHANGYDLGLVLFGINSLLMAWLFRVSGGVPMGIAVGIAGSGLVYITGGVARLLAPEALGVLQYAYALPMLAESALCLWLLVTGRV